MIYLDNAATSFPKPETVYQALDRFARARLANPGRSSHRMAVDCEQMIDDARRALNRFFHGEAPNRWVLAFNGTDALNMAIKGTLQPGDHVVFSDLEHNSVTRPLRALEQQGIVSLTQVASEDGYLEPVEIAAAITPRTAMVALTAASNVLGTVQPIAAIAPIVRAAGALFLVDAAQAAGVVPIDLLATPIDLLAMPGHKALLGPTGTGALYVGPRAQGRFHHAWREGGAAGDSTGATQPEYLPEFLEAGTHNVLGVAGLATGLAWINERGMEVNRRHEIDLLQKVVDWAKHAPGWSVAGAWEPEAHVGALSLITPEGLSPHEIAAALDAGFEIAVRPGLHCAPAVHQRLGTFPEGTLRVSPGPFNTSQDIDVLLGALDQMTAGLV